MTKTLDDFLAPDFVAVPVRSGGATLELTWDSKQAPILDSRVMVVLPDLHLGDGGDADIFRGSEAPGAHSARDRLELFLEALVGYKHELASAGRELAVLQVGDCYDVWRAYPFHENQAGRTYAAIEGAYGKAISLLIDDLDARFCVGNHDAILAKYPPDWAFAAGGRLAYAQRFCQGRVFGFHGHQTDALVEDMAAQNGQVWVAIGSAFSAIVNPLGMAIQEAIDKHADTFPGDTGGWPVGAPPPYGPFTATQWSNREGREQTTAKIWRGLKQSSDAVADAVRLMFVGHTHRPGIGWFQTPSRVIPVVDVGSWVYERTQFALVEEGRVTILELSDSP